MADKLDQDLALIEADRATGELKATAYFEDYLFKIIQTLGGEGSTSVGDALNNSEEALRIPYMNGVIARILKRLETVEGDLSHYKNAQQISQLIVDTAGYNAIEKNVPHTARHNDWVEASQSAPITLPDNPLKNHRVRLSIADNSGIELNSSSKNIKIRGQLTNSVLFRTAGESFDFHFFDEYWLAA